MANSRAHGHPLVSGTLVEDAIRTFEAGLQANLIWLFELPAQVRGNVSSHGSSTPGSHPIGKTQILVSLYDSPRSGSTTNTSNSATHAVPASSTNVVHHSRPVLSKKPSGSLLKQATAKAAAATANGTAKTQTVPARAGSAISRSAVGPSRPPAISSTTTETVVAVRPATAPAAAATTVTVAAAAAPRKSALTKVGAVALAHAPTTPAPHAAAPRAAACSGTSQSGHSSTQTRVSAAPVPSTATSQHSSSSAITKPRASTAHAAPVPTKITTQSGSAIASRPQPATTAGVIGSSAALAGAMRNKPAVPVPAPAPAPTPKAAVVRRAAVGAPQSASTPVAPRATVSAHKTTTGTTTSANGAPGAGSSALSRKSIAGKQPVAKTSPPKRATGSQLVRAAAASKAEAEAKARAELQAEAAQKEQAAAEQKRAQEERQEAARVAAARQAEERQRQLEADAAVRRAAEDRQRAEAEARAKLQLQAEKAKSEAEEKSRREAEEKARREAEEKIRRDLEEVKARREAVEKARREAEEKVRREAEDQEKEARLRREVEEEVRRETEARIRRETEEKIRHEYQEKARREAEERARREAEEIRRREIDERQRREAEAGRSRAATTPSAVPPHMRIATDSPNSSRKSVSFAPRDVSVCSTPTRHSPLKQNTIAASPAQSAMSQKKASPPKRSSPPVSAAASTQASPGSPSSPGRRRSGERRRSIHRRSLRGVDKEVHERLCSKYDVADQRQVVAWVGSIIGEDLLASLPSDADTPGRSPSLLWEALHDGRALCALANTVRPGAVAKINPRPTALHERENINLFLGVVGRFGLRGSEIFHVSDLHDDLSYPAVIGTLLTLARSPALSRFPPLQLAPKKMTLVNDEMVRVNTPAVAAPVAVTASSAPAAAVLTPAAKSSPTHQKTTSGSGLGTGASKRRRSSGSGKENHSTSQPGSPKTGSPKTASPTAASAKIAAPYLPNEKELNSWPQVEMQWAFTARSERELTLQAGELVAVQDKGDDGWWLGRPLARPHQLGFFPADYCQPAQPRNLRVDQTKVSSNILLLRNQLNLDRTRAPQKLEVVRSADGAKQGLLQWVQARTRGYAGVSIDNFTSSWRDGRALAALVHSLCPAALDWSAEADAHSDPAGRVSRAIEAAARLGVPQLVDADDFGLERLSMMTFLSEMHKLDGGKASWN